MQILDFATYLIKNGVKVCSLFAVKCKETFWVVVVPVCSPKLIMRKAHLMITIDKYNQPKAKGKKNVRRWLFLKKLYKPGIIDLYCFA